METTEKQQKLIVMFALLFNNVMYMLIVYILIVYAYEESLSNYSNEIAVFLGGVAICLIPSIIYAVKVVKEDIDRTKMIVRLAIYHVPSLLGLAYLLIQISIK